MFGIHTYVHLLSFLRLSEYFTCHNRLTALFQDHPGELVPEEKFWTLWCKGRLTEADTLTIRLGASPSVLTSALLHHPPIFYRPDALPAAQPTLSKHWRQLVHSDYWEDARVLLNGVTCTVSVPLCRNIWHNSIILNGSSTQINCSLNYGKIWRKANEHNVLYVFIVDIFVGVRNLWQCAVALFAVFLLLEQYK